MCPSDVRIGFGDKVNHTAIPFFLLQIWKDLVTLSIFHMRNNSSMSILIELKIVKHSPFSTNSVYVMSPKRSHEILSGHEICQVTSSDRI